jgi:ATP-dependent Clp protease ATP-binding subunit ClpC
MFERFTNRARHVVVLSQEEARLLSHNYIGTEHILLGLLGEADSVGGQVLAGFGFTLDGVREEVAAKVGRGKKAPSGHIPFTPRAKKTLELSLREALAIKHNYIGTEHILLGLIREGEGVAVQVMREHADPAEIRAAVLEAVSAAPGEPVEADEGTEETNAVLRWLRQRLTLGFRSSSVPFRPEVHGTVERPSRGTPAVEAALEHAARLAGPMPVGSHHLLLAALDDANSAASWALASLGVDVDELRSKLRTARLAGTSDEQPEQAGRRQMAINVSDETLTIVLTDPVIVEAGKEALRTLNARKAAAEKAAAERSAAAGTAAEQAAAERSAAIAEAAAAGKLEATTGTSGSAVQEQIQAALDRAARGAAAAAAASAGDVAAPAAETPAATAADGGSETASVTSTVIRGDHPAAAGLANVWLELRKTLAFLADTTPPASRTRIVRATASPKFGSTRTSAADPAEETAEPGEGEETA